MNNISDRWRDVWYVELDGERVDAVDAVGQLAFAGVIRGPFDPEEMLARAMISPDASGDEHEAFLRAWVRAELKNCFADPAAEWSRVGPVF